MALLKSTRPAGAVRSFAPVNVAAVTASQSITCHLCGNTFDPAFLTRSPGLRCPGCLAPLDQATVDMYHPEPRGGDPKRDAKLIVRDQAMADVETFARTGHPTLATAAAEHAAEARARVQADA